MQLTILNLPHVEDLNYPIHPEDCPVRFVGGDRDTLWAEDNNGRTWMKRPEDERWRCCCSFTTQSEPR